MATHEKKTTAPTESTVTADVNADVDDRQGAPVRIGREDREIKYAGES